MNKCLAMIAISLLFSTYLQGAEPERSRSGKQRKIPQPADTALELSSKPKPLPQEILGPYLLLRTLCFIPNPEHPEKFIENPKPEFPAHLEKQWPHFSFVSIEAMYYTFNNCGGICYPEFKSALQLIQVLTQHKKFDAEKWQENYFRIQARIEECRKRAHIQERLALKDARKKAPEDAKRFDEAQGYLKTAEDLRTAYLMLRDYDKKFHKKTSKSDIKDAKK